MTKTMLLLGACALPLLAAAHAQPGEPAAVDAANADDLDEIVVVGTRAAIRSALERKREADAVVDAITAEDIGQLPDLSIAESLERVTGVTANEDRGRPTQLIVRGLSADFTLTTLNGRELASGGNGREVTLGLFPSELITTAVVRKSAVADEIAGGIAGTIDLQTLRPLDRGNRRLLSANARAVYRDNQADVEGVNNPGWRGSFAYADRFADGRIGIAFGASYLDQPLLTDSILNAQPSLPRTGFDRTNGFGDIDGDGVLDFVPSAAFRYNLEGGNQERLGLLGAAQFKPSDNWDINVDVLYSESDQDFVQQNLIFPFVPGFGANSVRFDTIITDDAAVGDTTTIGGDPIQTALLTGAELSNVRLNVENTYRQLKEETLSGGINVAYENDLWAVAVDASYSTVDANRPFVSNTFRRDGLSAIYSYEPGEVPNLLLSGADLSDPVTSGNARQGFQAQLLNFGDGNQLEDDILSGRFDITRKREGSFFTDLSAGVRYVDRSKSNVRDVDAYGFGRLRGVFAPGVNPPPAANQAVADAAAPFIGASPFGRTFDDAGALVPRGVAFVDPQGFFEAAGELDPLGRDARDFTDGTFDVDEESWAGYVRADFEGTAGGRGLRGNFGLRVVHTEVSTSRVGASFTAARDGDGNLTGLTIDDINEETVEFEEVDNDYTNWLPSLNVVYDLQDDLLLRFAAGRAISRPVFSLMGEALQLTNATVAGEGEAAEALVFRGSSGNPLLDPYQSDQVDLSLEWYPSDDLAIVAGVFYKNISDFVANQSRVVSIPTDDGEDVAFLINSPINQEGSDDFYGLEFGYQQAFTGLPGWGQFLGVQANYTWLGTTLENPISVPIGNGANQGVAADLCSSDDPDDLNVICATAVQPPNNFAEHTGNLIGYFDNGAFNFRLVGNYKSEYPRQGDNLDQYRVQEAEFQLDASLAADLTDRVRLIAAATNLTNEPARLYFTDPFGGGDADFHRYTEFGTTYTLGLRVRM
jgi:TonB-dependent receptor